MCEVSVVIPLYNKEKSIKNTLNSVVNQTIKNIEILVVDDGSTDKSCSIAKSIKDERIRIISKQNEGISSARNYGIMLAKSNLITFLDADDEWKSNFLELILKLVLKYPSAGAYGTLYEIKYKNRKETVKIKGLPSESIDCIIPDYFYSFLMSEHPPLIPSSFATTKKVFKEIGLFQIGRKGGEDLDFFTRVALKYDIALSKNIGAIYNKDAENRKCNIKSDINELNELSLINNKIQLYKNKIIVLQEYKARLEIAEARRSLLFHNNRKRALKLLNDCKTSRMFWKRRLFFCFLCYIPPFIFNALKKLFSKEFK